MSHYVFEVGDKVRIPAISDKIGTVVGNADDDGDFQIEFDGIKFWLYADSADMELVKKKIDVQVDDIVVMEAADSWPGHSEDGSLIAIQVSNPDYFKERSDRVHAVYRLIDGELVKLP